MLEIKRLPSGYVRVQGNGPCQWAQVPEWPCDEDTLRVGCFPEASESFVQECLDSMEQLREALR